MTDINHTATDISANKISEIIDNLKTLDKLIALESTYEGDRLAVAEMVGVYIPVVISDLEKVIEEKPKQEILYKEFHQDLEESNS